MTNMMKQLRLIVEREYVTRVRRASFIAATFLTPLAFGVFIAIIHFIFRYESDDALRIAVVDPDHIFGGAIADEKNVYFKLVGEPADSLRSRAVREGDRFPFDAILAAPRAGQVLRKDYQVDYFSDRKLTLDAEPILLERLQGALRRHKIRQLNLKEEELTALDTRLVIRAHPMQPSEDDSSPFAGKIAAAIGVVMGLVMYTTVFIYGMMVMRGVMEEKTNRIVEVMVSSVRPFPLMMGKIIGIGAVGLTQVAVWAVLIPGILLAVNLIFGISPRPDTLPIETVDWNPADAELMIEQIAYDLYQMRWRLILPLFVLYFLGGYFMYAALFAAVGSAMSDDLGEGQSLTIPITIPVVLASYIMLAAIQAPHSTLAVWASIFPLFSPIVMPARLPFDPAWWQVALSLFLLGLTAVALVWLSGRIYRTGILLYGKKVSLMDLLRWMFR